MGVKRSEIFGFSLPAGHTCPAARECLSRADRATGKLTDGPECRFRCFAASLEAMYPSVRDMVWRNLAALQDAGTNDAYAMASLIARSMPKNAKIVRVHVSGDFFNAAYLRAWLLVADLFPGVIFYAYTKNFQALHPFVTSGQVPPNMRIMYSHGGRDDAMAAMFGYPTAYVVYTPAEAAARDLPIDHKDSLAILAKHDFALLIHGPQPKGSDAAYHSRQNRMRKS